MKLPNMNKPTMNNPDLESILQQEHEQDLELIRGKLVSETAKMPWSELQRFFANGSTLYVAPELDLIDVAFAFQRDLADQVKPWLDQALVATVSTDQAKEWFEQDSLLWTVVVKPWVLIQLPK
ncbi:MAG: hypothetical protein ACI9LY_004122 [Arenicella sp.]|jgi:hypothetical protein